ncbi:hypothetical protein KSP35_15660 [Aquihabitans sp. G128]|uniref:hypothetical protein n=1 Tax=Aquihabitans sp. G128 TaxID=2849779 RepID=UPI001C2446B2|nr:hypothetical protein [Aquihabitans sp. G128]QXC59807.1 hypothetical protein KSP35_15660 [Aquihabitans sp. G128]
MADDDRGVQDGRAVVVVPREPGPLRPLETAPGRSRDELDELIDDLLPDVEGGPGWFDATLVAGGLALVAWGLLGGSTFVLVIGILAAGLGCVLPVRSAWRRGRQLRAGRRTSAALATGVPLDVGSEVGRRLAAAYGALLEVAGAASAAVAAGHGAVLEAASLLDGRAPGTDREVGYVEERTVAIEALVAELRALPAAPDAEPGATADADAVVAARDELDRLDPASTLRRLEAIRDELRGGRRGRG